MKTMSDNFVEYTKYVSFKQYNNLESLILAQSERWRRA